MHDTVEPRLSGPPLSGTSIIRLGSFLVIRSENGRVPQTHMRVADVTMETCLLLFCACADNHVALLFINKVGGSRRGLSIRLSGMFTYLACFWNQGTTFSPHYILKTKKKCTTNWPQVCVHIVMVRAGHAHSKWMIASNNGGTWLYKIL